MADDMRMEELMELRRNAVDNDDMDKIIEIDAELFQEYGVKPDKKSKGGMARKKYMGGGMVRKGYKDGGMAKKGKKSSSCRGGGKAMRGTKFKGVR
jgi:hypothetical protein